LPGNKDGDIEAKAQADSAVAMHVNEKSTLWVLLIAAILPFRRPETKK